MIVKDLYAQNITQWTTTAGLRRTDCGVACIDTCLQYYQLGTFTVDQLVVETALMLADVGLTCEQVATLSNSHGLNCVVNASTTADEIKAQIEQGNLVIALIAYRFIPQRLDVRDNVPGRDGHFITLRGWTDDGYFIVDDSDYWNPYEARGNGVQYAIADVMAGITNSEQAGRCIFVQGKANFTVAYTTTVNTHGVGSVNLRLTPSLGGWIIRHMPNGAIISVLDGEPVKTPQYTWRRVRYNGILGYMTDVYLNAPVATPSPLPIPTPTAPPTPTPTAPPTTPAYPIGYDLYAGNDFDIAKIPVANSAPEFIFHKASEGTYSTDARFAERKAAAKQAGVLFAAYHFGTGGNVTAQVNLFLKAALQGDPTPLVLDLETNPDTSATSEGTMTLHQAAQFIQAVQSRCGVLPILYSRANTLDSLDNGSPDMAILRSCPLWVSSAHTPPTLPRGWQTWTFNQYAQTNGIDTDRFNGTLEELKAFWQKASPKVVQLPSGPAYVTFAGDNLNLRAAPGTATKSLAQLPALTPLIILNDPVVSSDGYTWVNVRLNNGTEGYVAQEFLKVGVVTQPPVTVTPAPTPISANWQKLTGPHLMSDIPNSDIEALQKYGVFKGMGYGASPQIESLKYLHQLNPSGTFIYRNYDLHAGWSGPERFVEANGGDVSKAVRGWISAMQPYLSAMPFAYFESFNESGMSDVYLAFEAERVRQLHAIGYKACVLNISGGSADWPDWVRAKSSGLLDAVSSCGALIGVHCYAQSVLSCSTGGSYFDASGEWHGDVLPASVPRGTDGNWQAWLALRVLRYIHDVIALGYGGVAFVITESGCDDCSQPGNGVYYPKEGKQNGWRQAIPTWQRLGWVNSSVSAEQFYLKQIQWMYSLIASIYPQQFRGGVIFTYGTADSTWTPFNVLGVL